MHLRACQDVLVKDERQRNHLIRGLHEAYQNGKLTDLSIFCMDGEELSAHKLILSSASPYFRNIIHRIESSRRNQAVYPVISVDDVDYIDVKTVIDFVYCGECCVPASRLASVRKCAIKFQIPALWKKLPEPDDESDGPRSGKSAARGSRSQPGTSRNNYGAGSFEKESTRFNEKQLANRSGKTRSSKYSDGSRVRDTLDESEANGSSDQFEESNCMALALPTSSTVDQETGSDEDFEYGVSQTDESLGNRCWSKQDIAVLIRAWNEESLQAANGGFKNMRNNVIQQELMNHNIFKTTYEIARKIEYFRRLYRLYQQTGKASRSIASHLRVLRQIEARTIRDPKDKRYKSY